MSTPEADQEMTITEEGKPAAIVSPPISVEGYTFDLKNKPEGMTEADFNKVRDKTIETAQENGQVIAEIVEAFSGPAGGGGAKTGPGATAEAEAAATAPGASG